MTKDTTRPSTFQPPVPPPFPGTVAEAAPNPDQAAEPVAVAVPPAPVAVSVEKKSPPAPKPRRRTRKAAARTSQATVATPPAAPEPPPAREKPQKPTSLRVKTKGAYPINLHVLNIMVSPNVWVEVPDHPFVRRQLELGSLTLVE